MKTLEELLNEAILAVRRYAAHHRERTGFTADPVEFIAATGPAKIVFGPIGDTRYSQPATENVLGPAGEVLKVSVKEDNNGRQHDDGNHNCGSSDSVRVDGVDSPAAQEVADITDKDIFEAAVRIAAGLNAGQIGYTVPWLLKHVRAIADEVKKGSGK